MGHHIGHLSTIWFYVRKQTTCFDKAEKTSQNALKASGYHTFVQVISKKMTQMVALQKKVSWARLKRRTLVASN